MTMKIVGKSKLTAPSQEADMTLATDRINQNHGAASFTHLMKSGSSDKEASGDFAALLMNLMDQRPAGAETLSFPARTSLSSFQKRDDFFSRPPSLMPRRSTAETPRATPMVKTEARQEPEATSAKSNDETEKTASQDTESVAQNSDTVTEADASEVKPVADSTPISMEEEAASLVSMVPVIVNDLLKSLEDDEQVQSLLAGLQPQQAQQFLADLKLALQSIAQEVVETIREGQNLTGEQKLQILIDALEKAPELTQLGLSVDRETFAPVLEQLLQKLNGSSEAVTEDFTPTFEIQEMAHEHTEVERTTENPEQAQVQRAETSAAVSDTNADPANKADDENTHADSQEDSANQPSSVSHDTPTVDAKSSPETPRFKVSEESLRQRFDRQHGESSESVTTTSSSESVFTAQTTKNEPVPVSNTAHLVKEYTQFEGRRPAGDLAGPTEEVTLKPAGSRKGFAHQQSDQGNHGSSGFERGIRADIAPGRSGQTEGLKHTVFNQLIEKAFMQKNAEATKTLSIQLKPEFLGKVDLELKSKDGVVTARLMAENPVVRDTIESLIPQIRDHLAEQGITLQQFTVDVYTRQSPGDSSSGQQTGENFSGSSAARRAGSGSAMEGAEPVEREKTLTNGNGMIDITV